MEFNLERCVLGRRCFRAGLFLSLWATHCATAAPSKRVLILDSFMRDVPPFSTGASAFRTTLSHELGESVNICEVPMDMERFADTAVEKPFFNFLDERLASLPVDLVVLFGSPAVRFAAQHRATLFRATPILCSGVDPRLVPPGLLESNATLVTQRLDLPGNIEDILQLQPDTTNIVVVLGASPFERFWAEQTRREWERFTNRVSFSYMDDLSLQQIEERVQSLPPHSFIHFGMLLMDADRVPYDQTEVLNAIHASANAPVFSYFACNLGPGAIGGRLYQDSQVGAQAARVAIR